MLVDVAINLTEQPFVLCLVTCYLIPQPTLCSYCSKLRGLLTIHLILSSVNKVNPKLSGSVHIYSNCLGTLNKVKHLLPHHIPSICQHSDVLKNLMLHCSTLSFDQIFPHVSAHQDNKEKFEDLSRQAQMNCAADFGAKNIAPLVEPRRIPLTTGIPDGSSQHVGQ
jgi:hypothetical protein